MRRSFAAVLAACLLHTAAAQQIVNLGAAPNTGTGDPARVAFGKANTNAVAAWAWAPTCTPPLQCSGAYSAGVTFSLQLPVATATQLAATPTQCTGGQIATGVTAFGNANCIAPPATGVTSVSMTVPSGFAISGSPITGVGTLALTYGGSFSPAQVLATPASVSGTLGVRTLAGTDIPAISLAGAGNGGVSGNLAVSHLNNGTGATAATCWHGDGTWSACVGSVGMTTPSWLTVAGSPVTSTGTFAVTATGGQTANQFLGTPDGVTGAVGLRAITANDIPLIPLATAVSGILGPSNGGTGNQFVAFTGPVTTLKTFTLPNVNTTILTANAAVTVAQGGTGVGTLTTHGVLLGEGTSNVGSVAAMAADTLLQGNGAGVDPAAVSVPACGSASQALNYNTTSHTFGCQTITGTGATTLLAIKSADTSRASVTTVAADPDLQFANVSSGSHTIDCTVIATTAGVSGGIKLGIFATNLTFGEWYGMPGDTASIGGTNGPVVAPLGVPTNLAGFPASGSTTIFSMHAGFTVSATALVTLQWAQGASNATVLTVKQGSSCRLI